MDNCSHEDLFKVETVHLDTEGQEVRDKLEFLCSSCGHLVHSFK